MARHHFYLQADWPGKRNDIGRIESGNLKTEISIPKEMDGPGQGQTLTKCCSAPLRLAISSRLQP